LHRLGLVCLVAGLVSPAAQQGPPGVIRAGTRLVEVEVVVRDKRGPVTGLTADDFTVLDQGKRQKIAVFSPAGSASTGSVAKPLPPGTISNRADRGGHPVSGATVLLFDQLNTSFDNQGYAERYQ
jgi:VWFA-related protein